MQYVCIVKTKTINNMIQIKGEIGADQSANLISVIEQMKEETGKEIHVYLDSIGGDMDEGISIYQYLKNAEKTIVTECANNCASIASVIFLAGEKRIAGCPILIHNPYLNEVSGDSKTLLQMSEFVRDKEVKLQQIYMQHTNLERAVLAQLMDRETYISPSQAVNLGFATVAKTVAVAKIKNATNKQLNNVTKMNNNKQSVRDVIRSIFGGNDKNANPTTDPKVYNMTLSTQTGDTLQVDRENGAPQVGDKASPDGSFLMPDDSTIVVENGVITAVQNVQNADTTTEVEEVVLETVEEMQNIINELKEEVSSTQSKLTNAEEQLAKAKANKLEDSKVLNAVRMAGGADVVFAKFSGVWKPQARQSATTNQANNALRDRINAIKGEK